MKKIDSRLEILKIIEMETDVIKSAIDRRNYWKRRLKKIDDDERRHLKIRFNSGGEQ